MADGLSLSEVAGAAAGAVKGDPATRVTDVTHDSRQAGPGTLFVAVRGQNTDGHRFVSAAAAAGAAAVCVERGEAAGGLPAIEVADTRTAMAAMAAAVHGHPSQRIRLVGVTGTNGKTTVTHILEKILQAAGMAEAIIGTVGARIRGEQVAVERTTPESSDFQRLLARMVDAGVEAAAVEVSSHALALSRVAATRFAVAAFTNLSQDHLDFHGDMGAYEAAKASLFDDAERAVVWIDDPAGKRIAAGLTDPTLVGTVAEAQVRVVDPTLSFTSSRFDISRDGVVTQMEVPLAGRFNVYNAAIAAACAFELGIPAARVAQGLEAVEVIPGRFELVDTGRDITVVVDYAHTPEAVSATIAAAREILGGSGRVIAVVGAAGDRDRMKRPLMASAAETADVAILTSDNPRTEDPAQIMEEMLAGATGEPVVEIDRRNAIGRALAAAGPGDAVLILGKGHEQGQEFADTVLPFDDRAVAREEAAAL